MVSTNFIDTCNRQVFLGSPRRGEVLTSARNMLLGVGAGMLVLLALLQDQPAPAKQDTPKEIYQDFRSNQPLLSAFKFAGPDIDTVMKRENEGLRITLPPARPRHSPVQVTATFPLVGDFEITGTYQLLSVTRPVKGYGSGVSLSVATTAQRRKFTKVGRISHPADAALAVPTKTGNVYTIEYWNHIEKTKKKDYVKRNTPTEAESGKLRLVREVDVMHYLVADSADGEFREIDRLKFGTEELTFMNFEVTDSGTPGNTVDVRLVDLRVRSAKVPAAEPSADPEPFADAGPSSATSETPQSEGGGTYLLLVVLSLLALGALGVGLALWRRNRQGTDEADPASAAPRREMISFACSNCDRNLKAKSELAGKKVKCPHCGKPVLIPAAGGASSGTELE